jgi:hypothetical protein
MIPQTGLFIERRQKRPHSFNLPGAIGKPIRPGEDMA